MFDRIDRGERYVVIEMGTVIVCNTPRERLVGHIVGESIVRFYEDIPSEETGLDSDLCSHDGVI